MNALTWTGKMFRMVATDNTVSADLEWGDFPEQMGIRR